MIVVGLKCELRRGGRCVPWSAVAVREPVCYNALDCDVTIWSKMAGRLFSTAAACTAAR